MDSLQQWAIAPYKELMSSFFWYALMLLVATAVLDLTVRVASK